LVELDYFKNIREIEGFLSNADPARREHVLGLLRNVVESHLVFRFYRIARTIPTSRRTLGNLIIELENSHVRFARDTDPPSVLSKLRMINQVSWRPHHGDPSPTPEQSFAGTALPGVTELASLIRETTQLIDEMI
jgi:hypothetical protein